MVVRHARKQLQTMPKCSEIFSTADRRVCHTRRQTCLTKFLVSLKLGGVTRREGDGGSRIGEGRRLEKLPGGKGACLAALRVLSERKFVNGARLSHKMLELEEMDGRVDPQPHAAPRPWLWNEISRGTDPIGRSNRNKQCYEFKRLSLAPP